MLRPTLGISPRHRADKPMPTVISYERYCYGANYSFHWLVCSDGTNCQQIRLVLSCHSLERKREARQPPKAVLFAHIRARSAAIATSVTGCCSGGARAFLTGSGGSLEAETIGWSQLRSIVLRKTHTAMQQHNAASNKNRNMMFPPFC